MTCLSALIARAIELKQGNKEFALFHGEGRYFTNAQWEAHLGNPTTCVALGEVQGQIVGAGETPEAAVEALIEKLATEKAAP